jgi:hypothetical protein
MVIRLSAHALEFHMDFIRFRHTVIGRVRHVIGWRDRWALPHMYQDQAAEGHLGRRCSLTVCD